LKQAKFFDTEEIIMSDKRKAFGEKLDAQINELSEPCSKCSRMVPAFK